MANSCNQIIKKFFATFLLYFLSIYGSVLLLCPRDLYNAEDQCIPPACKQNISRFSSLRYSLDISSTISPEILIQNKTKQGNKNQLWMTLWGLGKIKQAESKPII